MKFGRLGWLNEQSPSGTCCACDRVGLYRFPAPGGSGDNILACAEHRGVAEKAATASANRHDRRYGAAVAVKRDRKKIAPIGFYRRA